LLEIGEVEKMEREKGGSLRVGSLKAGDSKVEEWDVAF
jgi:hypothetical protein